MIKDNSPEYSTLINKEIQKFENIGKCGKVSKLIELTNTHIQVFKNKRDGLSLKIIAYILKGIFLLYKRSCENIQKDLQSFIEVYINGEKKKIRENQNKQKEKQQLDEEHIMSFKNFSLMSDSNSLGGFFNERTKTITERINYIKERSKNNNEYTPNREDLLSKILEKSITKSKKSLEIRDNESKMFDELNNLDLNFVYSKENFSNFLNFNIDQLAHDQEAFNPDLSKNNLTKLDENLFDEFKSDAFQTENKNLNDLKIKNEKSDFTNNEYKSINEPSKPNINQNLSALGYEFSKKIQIVNSKMTYDEDLEIKKDEEFLKNICDKRIFKKMNLDLFHLHYNKNVFRSELENFRKSFENIENLLLDQNMSLIHELLTKDFLEEEKKQEIQKDSSQQSINITERFRFENSTAVKNRRSIDSSLLMSNLSLNEVFEKSTDKQLLNKTTIFNDTLIPPNIILEEDSNVNLNTFSMNLKSHLNNFDLEFPQEEEKEEDSLAENFINQELLDEEIEKILLTKKKSSNYSQKISIQKITEKFIQKNPKINNEGQLYSIVFYRLLLSAQNNNSDLVQKDPFKEIFLI